MRHERNERFGEISPAINIPSLGYYLWEWYFDLSDSIRRVRDGVCEPFPPSEFVAWRDASGNIVYPFEYAILRAMDGAYCAETNKELADYRARQEEERNRNNPQFARMGYNR